MGNKGAKGTSRSPKKNAKLLEFSEDIGEVMNRNEAGSGRVQPRAVADATDKDGFLTPVVRRVKVMEGSSMETWSSLAAKTTGETAEEMGSVSEGDVSMSESCCSVTPVPIANKLRRLRESKLKAAMERSAVVRDQNVEDCIVVKPTEFEVMVELMRGTYEDLKNALRTLHLISKNNPNIFELASAANSKTDEAWGS
jgi:hypothetical protein